MSESNRYEYDDNCVAVIGIALRVPGADSVTTFWDNLVQGKICREELSEAELAGSPHATLCKDKNYIPYKYSISDYDLFDADYFQMSPREASLTDPQHRLILEYATRAFENAGYVPTDDDTTRTGVFACADVSHYLMGNLYPHFRDGSLDIIETFIGTGNDFLATRVAYKCNFKGPAMSIQTACSSSLTNLHMAVLSILGGECDRAVVASGTVLLPDLGYTYSTGGIHSPDGLCRPFDSKAEGTIFSNGVVAVVLKPMLEAVKDRDHIWAVIRGTASANDGSDKIGFVAPSVSGQARAISSALSISNTRPEDIVYVEGHGTGTQLGDPIEMEALLRVFGSAKERCATPITLGSVKGNIGHLNATAGLSGFVKTCLCMYHGVAPGTANFKSPNPSFGNITPFTISATNTDLRRTEDTPLLAGVSSFGFGGTNVHAILQEPPRTSSKSSCDIKESQLFVLSSTSEEGLRKTQSALAETLASDSTALQDASYTLATGRKHHNWRSILVAKSQTEAEQQLASGELPTHFAENGDSPVAFLFPGQGNLHAQAGYEFYKNVPQFREHLDKVAHIIKANNGPDIVHVMENNAASSDDSYLSSTAIAQPLLFGIETAFASTLLANGVVPDYVLGHSLGEYAAAVQAGIFSLEDAAKLVVTRAALMQSAPAGKMLMVTLNRSVLRDALGDLFDQVELSVVNGPSNCILTGPAQILDACMDAVEKYGQRALYLNTSHAFHSADMDGILAPFKEAFNEISLQPPSMPIVSNVTGGWGGDEMATPEYWVTHIRKTVEFDKCLATAAERVTLGLEVGPGHAMRSLGNRPDLNLSISPGLDAPFSYAAAPATESSPRSIFDIVGELWKNGGCIDWDTFYGNNTPNRCPVPETVLNPKRYWIDPPNEVEQPTKESSLPSFEVERSQTQSQNYTEPANDIEHDLVNIWQELLLIRPIGTTEEFLSLGGNSVQVVQMLRLAEKKGLHFSVKDVFEAKTVKELAQRVTKSSPDNFKDSSTTSVPDFFPEYVEQNGKHIFHATFSCPKDRDPVDLEKLATSLAERHESLRLRWDDNGVTIHAPNHTSWADDHVLHELTQDTLETMPEFPLAPLPASFPACTGDMPWYLALVPSETSMPAKVLAVFSWATCDASGAALLHNEIKQFIESGTFIDQPENLWEIWLNLLPENQNMSQNDGNKPPASRLATTVTEHGAEEGQEYSLLFEMDEILETVAKATKKTRMSSGEFVAYALAEIIIQHFPQLRFLTVWRDSREDVSPFHPIRSGAGSYRYPLHLDLGKLQPGQNERLTSFKEVLMNAESDNNYVPQPEESVELVWLNPADYITPATDIRQGILSSTIQSKHTVFAGMQKDIVTLMPSPHSELAGQMIQPLAATIQELTTGIAHEAFNYHPLPTDFPLCDLTAGELNRILEEAG